MERLRLTRSAQLSSASPGDPSEAWLRFRDCFEVDLVDAALAGEAREMPRSVGVCQVEVETLAILR